MGNWLKIGVLVAICLIPLFMIPAYAEQKCEELGTELIDGVCEITNYKLYNEYRITHIENFPDPEKSPQHYIDRYNTESEFKSWFDSEFPNESIEDVVGYRETHVKGFPDNSKSPEYYVKLLHLEEGYEPWFDKQFPTFQIYNIVGIDQKQYKKIVDSITLSEVEIQAREEIPNPCFNIREPIPSTEYQGDIGLNDPAYMEAFREAQYQYQQQIQHCLREYQAQIDEKIKQLEMESEPTEIICGTGTTEKDGFCVPERATMTTEMQQKSSGGGCLIATATFGSELAPQVQMLREIRDNSLLQTQSGQSFMQGFNEFYYSFSPTIADYERQNPVFKEAVKVTITPLLASLSLLNYVDLNSEESVLGYGIGIILMNVGMYFVAPALLVIGIYRKHKPQYDMI